MKAGGRVGMGSHGDMPGLQAHFEIWDMAMGGMPPLALLRSATLTGAEAIGKSKELGSIEVGKLADLQILDRNPLEDIHNTISVSYVMKYGRLYESMTLNEIYPRRRALHDLWWWNEDAIN